VQARTASGRVETVGSGLIEAVEEMRVECRLDRRTARYHRVMGKIGLRISDLGHTRSSLLAGVVFFAGCFGGDAEEASTATEAVATTVEASTTVASGLTTTTTAAAATTTTEANPFNVVLAGIRHGMPQPDPRGGGGYQLVFQEHGVATMSTGGFTWAGYFDATPTMIEIGFPARWAIRGVLWDCEEGDDYGIYSYALVGDSLVLTSIDDECDDRSQFLTSTAWQAE
jgi:hypothetical protein